MAGPAMELIVAMMLAIQSADIVIADKLVVIGAAMQHIIPTTAIEGVVARPTMQGVTAMVLSRQIRLRSVTYQPVITVIAMQKIIPTQTKQGVIARTAMQAVIAMVLSCQIRSIPCQQVIAGTTQQGIAPAIPP